MRVWCIVVTARIYIYLCIVVTARIYIYMYSGDCTYSNQKCLGSRVFAWTLYDTTVFLRHDVVWDGTSTIFYPLVPDTTFHKRSLSAPNSMGDPRWVKLLSRCRHTDSVDDTSACCMSVCKRRMRLHCAEHVLGATNFRLALRNKV